MYKKQIVWNYEFELFEDEIHNMNNTCYSDLHTCTESKSAFILAEEQKTNKTNKISDTKKSKENIAEAANAGNNKAKEFKQKKKDQKSNKNSSVNKNCL